MLTMLIDHVGDVFYPDLRWMRLVGRIAMPLYTYGIVRGYALTHSRRRYALRLLIIAVTAQLACLVLWPGYINIVWGFLAGVGLFAGLDAIPQWVQRWRGRPVRWLARTLQGALLLLAYLLFWFIPVDYGIYLLSLLLLYRYVQRKWVLVLGHAGLNLFLFGPLASQGLSVISTVLLVLPFRYPPMLRGRWFYRAFYPAHLAALAAIAAAQGI